MTWREIWPGHDAKVVYRLWDGSTLFAALVPVDTSTISGISANTDYWLGDHPDDWPTSFTFDKIVRTAPTTAAEAKSYTLGSVTLSSWHSTDLEEFVGSSTSHTWTSGRAWEAEVPDLRTTIDHYINVVWNGSDFEWVVTTEDTDDYIDLDTSESLSFSERSSLTIVGVKATDV